MYNIYMPAWGEADYLMGTMTTELEAKEVVDFFNNHLIKENENDSEPLYYKEIVPISVVDLTTKLDLDYGVRNEAWVSRHNVVF
jgi:hypothetical protein